MRRSPRHWQQAVRSFHLILDETWLTTFNFKFFWSGVIVLIALSAFLYGSSLERQNAIDAGAAEMKDGVFVYRVKNDSR